MNGLDLDTIASEQESSDRQMLPEDREGRCWSDVVSHVGVGVRNCQFADGINLQEKDVVLCQTVGESRPEPVLTR